MKDFTTPSTSPPEYLTLPLHLEKLHDEIRLEQCVAPHTPSFFRTLQLIDEFVRLVECTGPEVVLLGVPPAMRPLTDLGRLERFFRMRVFEVSVLAAWNGRVRFTDRVQVFLDVVESHQGVLDMALAAEGVRANGCGQAQVDLDVENINLVIRELRQRVQERGFRIKLSRSKEKAKRSLEGMQSLVVGLFERHARLLVVRMDFGYLKKVHEANHAAQQQGPAADVQMALADRAALFNNLRHKPSISEHLLGYILKLEQGSQGGCHFHAFFFFDGSKRHAYYWQAKLIGEYWRDCITKGRGRFHICHPPTDSRKATGVGLIDHYDQKKRDALMNDAITYLVNDEEQGLTVKPLGRIATLTHSNLPKDTPKPGPKRIANRYATE